MTLREQSQAAFQFLDLVGELLDPLGRQGAGEGCAEEPVPSTPARRTAPKPLAH
ncbi:hypothetical protein [Streptomyces sp. N2A]|uniref:hypothetical protein n=1 Tax=Streptomyces sp. N2A TaxID=3073936 RepID=UPI00287030A6|nr:hypothetical protein [Streptomyces sp. N2A]